jgi:hypothetical protein
MMNENNGSDVRVSNWTLATGTRAGERHVYHSVARYFARSPAPQIRP